ncbi:MAG: hypothetical protein IMZ64_08980 [Bacteroidetes bacterium]|nr:hypothetical protein [Bacteroidota bacterium]
MKKPMWLPYEEYLSLKKWYNDRKYEYIKWYISTHKGLLDQIQNTKNITVTPLTLVVLEDFLNKLNLEQTQTK